MKKVLALVLVLFMLVGMLAGCGCQRQEDPTEPSVSTPEGPTASEAMEYLRAIYKDTEEPTPTPVNYDRYGIVRIAGVPFTVVWSVDVSEDLIKIVVNEDGSVTIDVNEACEVATPYTLTATITDEYGNTATHSWDMILPAAVDMVEVVKAAYALAPGESLPYQSTLRGKITAINTVYSAEYKNITVTIVVEGAEDMPVMCYRLKGDGIDKLLVGNIITVTGTLKNYNGTIEFDAGCTLDAVEEGEAVEAITDPGEILKAAYALKEDTQLPNPATLTGTVIEIDSPYDPNYGNISVVIEVEGYPQYPILCYRMKGTGVDQIAVNDLITVTGIIKNYKGTIEFDAGCQMTDRVSGGGVAQGPSSDQNKILSDANKLAVGEKLPYLATLTGEVYSVDTPYSAEYGNVTVTMLVGGQKIQCYRMIGDGVDQIRETDTITVTGIIENYNGKLEFGAKCNLDSWTKGPRNVNYGSLKEETAYRLYVKQTALEKTLYFTGEYSGSRLSTSSLGSEGVDVFVERVSGKGLRFYFMDGETKTYIGVEDYTNDEGKVRGRTVVGADVVCYWTYDSTLGVYVSTVQAGKHFLGTYSTYETISASWTGYIDGTMSGSSQYIAKFMLASDVPADDAPALAYGTYTTTPEVGVAYKLGLDQTTKECTYYFTGAMSTYYGATEADYSKGVDVYLEEADGGYYLYFMDGSAKQYVYIVANGTHMNFTYSTSNKSVFTYDTELNSLYTSVDGAVYYMGTYGSYVTVGTTAESKVADSYVTHLYTSATGGTGGVAGDDNTGDDNTGDDTTGDDTTDATATVVTNPAASTAYKMGMDKGDGTILYFNGQTESASVNYRLATTTNVEEAVDVYLEEVSGGYQLYFMNGETKTYIRVYHRTDGDPGYGKGSLEFVTTAPTEVFGYDTTANTLVYDYDGNNAYYMGTYSTYTTFSVSNTSYITGSNAANVDVSQFPARFYTVTTTEDGDDTTGDDTTGDDTTGDDTTTTIALEDGDQVVIYAPAYNKALSVTKADYYNAGVDITVTDGVVSGYGDTEVFTVIVNSDGTYSFANGGQNIGLADSYSSMNLGTVNDDWALEDLGNGLYNVKNTGRGNYMEWYNSYSNWSTYASSSAATDDQFQLSFYVIGKGILGGDTTGDDTTGDDTTGDDTTGDDTTTTIALEDGDQVVIYAPAYNKALSVTKADYYNAGVDITVTDGVVSGYGDTEVFTVIVNSDGTYSFANGGQNIGLADSYSSMNLGTVNDDWALEDLGNGLYNVKNTGRGNYMEWYNSYSNWSTYASSSAATDDQFQLSFYVIGKGILGGDTTGDDTTGDDTTGDDTTDTPVTGSGTLELTVTSLSIADQTYYTGTATVDGIDFDLTQIGNYGNGVQMRDKNGNTSILFNTVALPGNITKIELTSNAGKTVYDNADAVIFSFGDAQDNLTYTTKLSTVAGQTSYTITPEGDFTFFKIEHDLGFTLYWDSIVIYYGAEGDDTTGDDTTGDDTTTDTPATGSGTLELTVTSLSIADQTYYTGTATVDGIDFDLTQIGNYGNGVQMRDKNGNTSILFNTVALPGNITKIELTSNAGKTVYDNADAVIFSFGDAQDNLTYTTKLSTVAGQTSYTITPEGDFTFFKIEHDLGFTLYWDSIVIYYGAEGDDTTGDDTTGDDTTGDDTTGDDTTVDTAGTQVVYTMSAYTTDAIKSAGTYTGVALDSDVTVDLTQSCINTQIRLYNNDANKSEVIVKSANAVKALILNVATNNASNTGLLNVYGSNDNGATWTEIDVITVSGNSYGDVTVADGNTYSWIKFTATPSSATTTQIRIAVMTLVLPAEG